MLRTRVIPVLLLHNKGLVKTVRFKDPKYVGDPINAIRIFNEKEVDELIFLDIDASKDHREPDYALIESFASECFMPVCYGGGITNVEQIRKIFSLGIEKVALNSSALRDKDLIREASQLFGAQSIIVAVDVKRNLWGRYQIYRHADKGVQKGDLLAYLREVEALGAGEVFLNSVDMDGMQKGYDMTLLQTIRDVISVPVIVCGGAGQLSDFKAAKELGGASAVAAGSFFVFQGKHRAVLITYPKYEELEKLFGERP
ncbi:AglZ/HisF2 family acetamidino modification protein [Sulfurimonas sp. HSL1-6]|uniref:AglZ/HisF2 family acetamidino modification protein n=1 Tax=Thiomicrolovo immobilis TaxID=3131935 RepID=UPI0031F76295